MSRRDDATRYGDDMSTAVATRRGTHKRDPAPVSVSERRACYQAGCRLEECVAGNAEYRRERYAAQKDGDGRTARSPEPTVPISTRVSKERAAEIEQLRKRRGISLAAAAREVLYVGLDNVHDRRRR